MGFHVGRASAGSDAAVFIFYEEFADERLAEARGMALALSLTLISNLRIRGHTVIFAEHQNSLEMARHRGEC